LIVSLALMQAPLEPTKPTQQTIHEARGSFRETLHGRRQGD
jgi:hypothetical protein